MNSHTPPNPDLQELPAELHALYGALAEDGAAWRDETPALGPRLDAFARGLAASPTPGTVVTEPEDDATIPLPGVQRTPPRDRSLASRETETAGEARHPHHDRRRGLLAVAAMAAVVALLAVLFHNLLPLRQINHGPTPSPSPSASPHGTATPALTPGPSGQWQSLDALTYGNAIIAGGGPAIAPSNPLVVYEPELPGPNRQASLHRTEDGGKSWVDLSVPFPAGAALGWFGAVVSPLDARTVYVMAEVNNPSSCPPATSYPRGSSGATSGSGPCVFNFMSTDAGSQWQPLNIGVGVGIGPSADAAKPSIVAQGTRLYATGADTYCFGEKSMICTRILTSTDGVSWSVIDRFLTVDQNQFICDWAATPHGTTVFAVTGAENGEGCSYYPHSLSLWRTDNAGASWTRVGMLPTPNIRGLVATGGSGAPITLYANLPATVGTTTDNLDYPIPVLSDAPGDLQASTDGGKTWHSAPTAGIGGGLLPGAQPMGALSDGAVLMPFTRAGSANGGNPTFYAWAAGTGSWQLVASPDNIGAPQSLLVIPAGRRDTLWVVVPKGDATSGEYDVYEYTT